MQAMRDAARAAVSFEAVGQASDVWRAFLSGNFSAVDCFDQDGRRHLIVRRNHVRIVGRSPLSRREQEIIGRRARGEALKIIADAVGISISSTSRSLRRAMSKVGARSHVELARMFGGAT